MQTLNAQDSLTGETVRFDWDGSAPPSDADLEHIFGEVRRQRAVAPDPARLGAPPTAALAADPFAALADIGGSGAYFQQAHALAQPTELSRPTISGVAATLAPVYPRLNSAGGAQRLEHALAALQQQPLPTRSVWGELGVGAQAGLNDLEIMQGRLAARFTGDDTGLARAIGAAQDRNELLGPSAQMQESYGRRSLYGGARSLVANIPTTAMMAITPSVGMGYTGALYGVNQYDEVTGEIVSQLTAQGYSAEQAAAVARWPALRSAFYEGGLEALFGRLQMGLSGLAPAVRLERQLARLPLAGRTAARITGTIGTEALLEEPLQNALSAAEIAQLGLNGVSPLDAALESIGPAAVATAPLALIGGAHSYQQDAAHAATRRAYRQRLALATDFEKLNPTADDQELAALRQLVSAPQSVPPPIPLDDVFAQALAEAPAPHPLTQALAAPAFQQQFAAELDQQLADLTMPPVNPAPAPTPSGFRLADDPAASIILDQAAAAAAAVQKPTSNVQSQNSTLDLGPGTLDPSPSAPTLDLNPSTLDAAQRARLDALRARLHGPVESLTYGGRSYGRDADGTWYRRRVDLNTGQIQRLGNVSDQARSVTGERLVDVLARELIRRANAATGGASREIQIEGERPAATLDLGPRTLDPIEMPAGNVDPNANQNLRVAAPVAAPVAGAETLSAFIRRKGGFTLTTPEGGSAAHAAEFAELYRGASAAQRRGMINSQGAMYNTPDYLTAAAIESGFLPAGANINDLHAALGEELQGSRYHYSTRADDLAALSDAAEARAEERDWQSAETLQPENLNEESDAAEPTGLPAGSGDSSGVPFSRGVDTDPLAPVRLGYANTQVRRRAPGTAHPATAGEEVGSLLRGANHRRVSAGYVPLPAGSYRAVAVDPHHPIARAADAAARALGLRLVWFERANEQVDWISGARLPGTNTILLDVRGGDPVLATITHEAAHALRELRPEAWTTLVATLRANAQEGPLSGWLRWYNERYGGGPLPLQNEELAEEFVANLLGEFGTQPQFWADLNAQLPAAPSRTVLETLLALLDRVLQQLGAQWSTRRRASATIQNLSAVRQAAAQALAQLAPSEIANVESPISDTTDQAAAAGELRFSLAGEKALANLNQRAQNNLLVARQMLSQAGLDEQARLTADNRDTLEKIRSATGWTKGLDGQWRFEIDDSGLRLLSGWRAANTIGEAVQHEALFAAYPDLRQVRFDVINAELPDDARGFYSHAQNRIVVRGDLFAHDAREVLLHELQHAIQEREGFARGTSPERAALELQQEAAQLRARARALQNSAFQQHGTLDETARQQVLDWERQARAIEERANTAAWSGLRAYQQSAGEIEARDTAARGQYKSAQRNLLDFTEAARRLQYIETTAAAWWDAHPQATMTDFEQTADYARIQEQQAWLFKKGYASTASGVMDRETARALRAHDPRLLPALQPYLAAGQGDIGIEDALVQRAAPVRFARATGQAAREDKARAVQEEAEKRWPGVVVELQNDTRYPEPVWHLSSIVVPKDQRGDGVGTQVMEFLGQKADEAGATITLSPSTDFGGTSVERLRRFYRRFQFVRNTGRTADDRLSGAMYRTPRFSRVAPPDPAQSSSWRQRRLAVRGLATAVADGPTAVGDQSRAVFESNMGYNPVGDALLEQQASDWMESYDQPMDAYRAIMNPTTIVAEDVRAAAAVMLTHRLQALENDARTAGQGVDADRYGAHQAALWQWMVEVSTAKGRATSYMRLAFGKAMMEVWPASAWEAFARDQIRTVRAERAGKAVDRAMNETAAAVQRANAGAAPAAGARAARRASERSALWPRYQQAIANAVAASVRRKLSADQPRVTAPLQEFAQRLASTLRDQVRQSLTQAVQNPGSQAQSQDKRAQFVASLQEAFANPARYAEALAAVQAKLRAEYADNPAALAALDAFLSQSTAGTINATLLAELVKQELHIGELVRQHYSQVQNAGTDLAAALVAEAQLDPAVAAQVQQELTGIIGELTATAKRQALERLTRVLPKKQARAVRSLGDRVLEASNLGAFAEEKLWNALAEKLQLPAWNEALAAELRQRADAVQRRPAGAERQEAIAQLLGWIAAQHGVKIGDLAWSAFYASILSGYKTHLVNFLDTAVNVVGEFQAQAIAEPLAVAELWRGLAIGAVRGLTDARGVLATGVVTGTRMHKHEAMNALELRAMQAPWYHWTRTARYVGRAMAAEDMFNFRAGEAMRSHQLAWRQARAEGVRGRQALKSRVDEILGRTRADLTAAASQAASEGLTGWRARRRAWEILEQARPAEMVQAAAEFGRRATYNQDPEGVLGRLSDGMAAITHNVPAVRAIVPFTRVVANVFNRTVDYSPVGYYRAYRGMGGDSVAPTGTDRRVALIKATEGTLVLGALAAFFLAGRGDEEDPYWDITAEGPANAAKRQQLEQRGWMPFSIKIGDRYVSYRYTPFHLVGAIVGAQADAQRYGTVRDRNAIQRLSLGLGVVTKTVLGQTYLSGLADFLEDVTRPNGNALNNFNSKLAGIAVPRLVQDLDALLFDPSARVARDPLEALTAAVPLARTALNPPRLDVFGQPVERPRNVLSRFTRVRAPDNELDNVLARRGLFVPGWGNNTMLPTAERTRTPADRAALYDLNAASGPLLRQKFTEHQAFLARAPREQAQRWINRETEKVHRRVKAQYGLIAAENEGPATP